MFKSAALNDLGLEFLIYLFEMSSAFLYLPSRSSRVWRISSSAILCVRKFDHRTEHHIRLSGTGETGCTGTHTTVFLTENGFGHHAGFSCFYLIHETFLSSASVHTRTNGPPSRSSRGIQEPLAHFRLTILISRVSGLKQKMPSRVLSIICRIRAFSSRIPFRIRGCDNGKSNEYGKPCGRRRQ